MKVALPLPPGWLRASLVVSLGCFLNGYDTGSIGALTTMPAFAETFGVLSATQLGLLVSTVMLGGGVPALFAGRLAAWAGAARALEVGAIVLLVGAAIDASASSLAPLFVGRAIVGLGQGLLLTNVTVYICEIAPSARRGMLVGTAQLIGVTGIVAGFFTCFGSAKLESSLSWRTPFIVQCVVALTLVLLLPSIPASPRWLLSKGRRADAQEAIARLSIPPAEAEKDILQPFEAEISEPQRYRGDSFRAIFAAPVRVRTFLALFLLSMIQLTGIDAVLYYAPLLFHQAGLSAGNATFLASGGSGLAIFAVSIPAFWFADRIGRRRSLIGGGLGMTACMFIIGALYEAGSVHDGEGNARWVVITLIFIFVMLYSATWAMSAKLYAGEILAPQTRLAANSFAQGVNFFMNFLVSLSAPILLSRSTFAAYFVFGSLTLFTVAVCAFYMPETKGLSLEAIHSGALQKPGQVMIKNLQSAFQRKNQPRLTAAGRDAALSARQPGTPSAVMIELQDVSNLLT